MKSVSLFLAVLVFGAGLSAAEATKSTDGAKPAEATKPATGKVDKALTAPAKEPRIWAEVDYLGLSASDSKGPGFPVLTTMLRPTNSHRNGYFATGELDIPGVSVLYGTKDQDLGWSHGFKGAFGGWLDEEREWGAELNGFIALGRTDEHSLSTDNVPDSNYLGVPYYNVFTQDEDSAALGITELDDLGTAQFSFKRNDLWGVGVRGLRNLVRQRQLSLDASFGFRHVNLSEEFSATYSQLNDGGADVRLCGFLTGTSTSAFATAQDRVEAQNRFYGADLGVRFSYRVSRFMLDVEPRMALGAMAQTLDTSGSCRVWNGATGATLFTADGGFFARPNVVGERSETVFAFIPNVAVKAGVKITENLQFKVGYEFLYISNVVYAGNQLDRRISLPRDAVTFDVTGPATGVSRPFRNDDFMAHGVTAGFTIRF